MLLRDHDSLCQPILDYLRDGERPAWEIEEELARLFNVTEAERAQRQPHSGVPVFTNDVAFALKKLVETRRITKSEMRRSPRGGRRGVYRLGASAR
jgi:restriction endonuclease Mrr